MQQVGRRIGVVGCSGSGKSFVAQAVAQKLEYRYVCNDELIWGPNWVPVLREERVGKFSAALAGEGWTIDGNIGSGPEDRLMLERIDTLVWLDLPFGVVFRQLFKRTVERSWKREELWHGNRETWRHSFASKDSVLLWMIRTHGRTRKRYEGMFGDVALERVCRVRLRSRREIDEWIDGLARRDVM